MYFEKVDKSVWQDNIKVDVDQSIIDRWYDEIKLPKQGTAHSAGMDFFTPFTIKIMPHAKGLIPTGVRWVTDVHNKDKMLTLYPRSGLGFKHGIRLMNTVGIVDADFCNSDNGGHIMIKLYNPSDEPITLNKGQAFAQGIITQYYICESAESSDSRTGGFGSTDRK